MNIVKCNNGHFFDMDRSELCPHCIDEGLQPEMVSNASSNIEGSNLSNRPKKPFISEDSISNRKSKRKKKDDLMGFILAGIPAEVYYPCLVRINTGEKIRIGNYEFKIGRDKNVVDYCITNDASVSRCHCSIVRKYEKYYIIDHLSTNHTYLDGKVIRSGVQIDLYDGAKIKIGDEWFEFQLNRF